MIMLHLYIPRYPDFERLVVYRHTLPLHLPKPPGQRQQQSRQPPRHVRGGGRGAAGGERPPRAH